MLHPALYRSAAAIALVVAQLSLAAEAVPAAAAAPYDLLENGGFEEGDTLPAWWRRYPPKDERGNRHLRDTAAAHSGKASALLWSVAPHTPGKAGMQWNRYGIAVEGGAALVASFWVRTEGVAAAGAGCHFYDSDRKHLGFVKIDGPARADDWTLVRKTVRVPAAAKTMGFALYARDLGKTWYDDVALLATPATAAVRASPTIDGRLDEPCWSPGRAISGFVVVLAPSLAKVRRSGPVVGGLLEPCVRLDAARDEAEAFQLVVVPGAGPLEHVTVEAPPLTGPGGTIPIAWHRVGYVKTAPPSYKVAWVGWWPDVLLPPSPFGIRAGQRQPLWFTVAVPPDATPGAYEGTVTVRCGGRAVGVPVALWVRNFRLPRPGTLATAFGLYASALSRGYYGTAPYRDKMPIETYARWCRFLAERRLTPKNVAREYISVTKEGDGWAVGLSALEHTVAPLAGTHYAPYSFCLHRTPTASALWRPGAKPDPEGWAAVTGAIADEWTRQRLPDQVYIYGMDEPRPTDYPVLRDLYARIRKAAPGYPIMQTIGDRNPTPLVGLVDIWCPLSARLDAPFYAARRRAGDRLWTYVCCSPKPPYANFFVDQPATAHRVLFWQAWQHGCTGVLYWCVCWWSGLPSPCSPDAPIDFAALGTYQKFKANGDGLLVYPGPDLTPWSSIRLEIVRDGIEDYEYLALLRRLIARAKALPPDRRPAPDWLARAESLCDVPPDISRTLTDYTHDPAPLIARRRAIGNALERLTALLGDE